MEYLDFELAIERVGERYRAKVIDSPAGVGAQTEFDLSPEVAGWPSDPGSGSRTASERHLEIEPPTRDGARELGRELFDRALASGPVRTRWRASLAEARAEHKGLRLRLHFPDDPVLLQVPWELLYDPRGGSFLAQSEETPVIRSLEVAGRRREMRVDGAVRFLALLSCPPMVVPLQVERELEFLKQALALRIANRQATLEHLARATLPDLLQYQQRGECHVLHFIGHGVDGALALERSDGETLWVDDEKLEAFFGHSELRLVVLNACQGARAAPTLVRRGVPAVIAMQCDVTDEAAVNFARHFYHALAEGLPVEGAISRARLALFAALEGSSWAIPVLYMRAWEGQIWEGEEPTIDEHGKDRWAWWKKLPLAAKIALVMAVVAALGGAGILLFGSSLDSSTNHLDCPSPPGLEMNFVRIEPGSFDMGQSKGDKTDEPVHRAEISRPFCLGAFELTRAELHQILGRKPPNDEEKDLPASGLSFLAARDVLDRLNRREKVAGLYRLPTEAEWEYAARAGTATRYFFGDDGAALPDYANCKEGDSFPEPAPVGRFLPNGFGLYDVYGNVFEWVSDWYGDYPAEAQVDPHGPSEGTKRIRRGGSWESGARACSSAARSGVAPDREDRQNGFRIVREIR